MNSFDPPNDHKFSVGPPIPPPLPPESSTRRSLNHSFDNSVQPPVLVNSQKKEEHSSRQKETPFDGANEEEFDDFPLGRRQRPEAEMDMTPMVDVVFLLLIFFMITAAFGLQKSIEIPDPENDQSSQQAKQVEEKEENNILVHITGENRVFVEGEEASTQQELYAKLREQMHQRVDHQTRHLLVFAESKATHELVVRVLDAASGVGMDSIRLKTE